MESNKQTELASKTETDQHMENRRQLVGGGLGVGGIEQKGRRTQGHGQQCGYHWGKEGLMELNGNGKIY